ncbi:MAG: hypothetical protein ACOYOH_26220 [Paracraurococcus sp.]
MLKILREYELAKTFRSAAKKSAKMMIAVPYWGKGAVATLGLVESAPARIICNLSHPGCNPEVIQELRDLKITVRSHPRLHAKIYATANLAILGSSNVSTNGLTEEGVASRGWIEANACSDNPTFVEDVHALFEQIWLDPETKKISKTDITAAIEARKNWPLGARAPLPGKTLLAACRARPADFRSVYVATYSEDLGPNGKRVLSNVKKQAQPPKPGLDATDFRKAWGYQFGELPEGAWLIDVSCKKPGHPSYGGCAKVTGLRLPVLDETDLTIAIPGVVVMQGSGIRLPISAKEKASLVRNAERMHKRNQLLPLPDAIKIIDRSR